MGVIPVKMPAAFKDITKPARYKVFHGGRGGAKSETIARYLLLAGKEEPMTILCAREFQSSIKDSVKQVLDTLIQELELQDFYRSTLTEIVGVNGTKFIFAGLRHNINNIKSIPNIKKCWVEEAHTVSENSWKVLIPTIRADKSEIIISFNPDMDDDPTYVRFVLEPPENSIVRAINYRDNPYFPDVLEQERLECKKKHPLDYDNIWEGKPRTAVEGAIFAKQIQEAYDEGRIMEVEYNSSVPVNTYWDLGKRNKTAIWFCQYVGMQWRVLRCESGFGVDLEDYFKLIESMPYRYGMHWLPHDAKHDRLGMQRSIEEQARARLGMVDVVPQISHKVHSIEAAKQIFPLCWFDKENCEDGLRDLRRYAYKVDEDGKVSKEPDHKYSDVADAFQCFAMAAQPDSIEEEDDYRPLPSPRLG